MPMTATHDSEALPLRIILLCPVEAYSNLTSGTGAIRVRQGFLFANLTQFLEGSRVYPDTWEPPGPVRLEWWRIEVSRGGSKPFRSAPAGYRMYAFSCASKNRVGPSGGDAVLCLAR